MRTALAISNERSARASRRGQAWVGMGVGFLLVYSMWVWAGIRPSFHLVAVAGAVVLLGGFFFRCGARARKVFRDPVFWLGLAFLGFLTLQWANAGREQYFDVGYQRWTYTTPRWPNWPWAYARSEAAQMLAWFFPAWTLAVVLRAPVLDRRAATRLLRFCVYAAAALSVFGMVQYASGTSSIYWRQPLKTEFFASFGYRSHAPPFFILMSAVAAGLMYREIFESIRHHSDSPSARRLNHPVRVAVLLGAFILCLAGAFIGFSQTGIILSGVFSVVVLVYGWVRGWRRLTPAGRLNFGALSMAVAGGLVLFVVDFGQQGIRQEFSRRSAERIQFSNWREVLDVELGRRPHYVKAAIEIWRENPWFGVGGWGYRYEVAQHVPVEFWPVLEKRGWANVHCDAMQFLAEFGVLGFGLLMAALGILVRAAWPGWQALPCAFRFMSGTGLILVVGFSMIDLPFRSPAILYAWVTVLALLPVVCAPRHASIAVDPCQIPSPSGTPHELT